MKKNKILKGLEIYAEDENLKKQIKSYIDTSVDFYLNDKYKFDNLIWSVAGDSNKEVRKQIMSYLLGRKAKSNEYGITDIKFKIISKADYKLKILNLIKELKSL